MKNFLHILLLLLLFTAGVWSAAVMSVVLHLPRWMDWVLFTAMIILFAGAFTSRKAALMLAILELSSMVHFMLLTPQEQFADKKFMRIFAVKPAVNYLPDGTFEVINYRDNRYRTMDDYEDNFIRAKFDPAKVEALEMASVHWDNMAIAAHTMFNFKFSDGKELTVSVEPRTPEEWSRAPFHCLCKQQELLFVLGSPQDIFDLRVNYRGEDLYLYQMKMSPAEIRIFLDYVIARADKLAGEPEFYHLLTHNCITALLPGLKKALPELDPDWRIILNGEFPRMLYSRGLLECREGESFESLKSRSFRKGKSQGKL